MGARRVWGLPAPTWCQFSAERLIFLTELGCNLFISLGGGGGELGGGGMRVAPPRGMLTSPGGLWARSSQLGMTHPTTLGIPEPPSHCCPEGSP